MPNPTVILSRCSDYNPPGITEALQRQFELLGGLEKFVTPGDTVLLKPNFIAPRSRRHATQTDPAVIIETARLLKDFGAKPFVGDSPAWGNVFTCVKALQLEEPLKKLSVPVKHLDKPKWSRIGAKNIRVGISSVALDADVIINLCQRQAKGTLALYKGQKRRRFLRISYRYLQVSETCLYYHRWRCSNGRSRPN